MCLQAFYEGLTILLKYYGDKTQYHLVADRESIYLYPTDHQISTDDLVALIALGWIQDDEDTHYIYGDRDYGDEDWSEFSIDKYDKDKQWVFNV